MIKDPESIKLTEKEVEALSKRIEENNLSKEDRAILQKLLQFSLWLNLRLSRAKLTIKKLRKLFGFKTEKRGKHGKGDHSKDDGKGNDDDDSAPPNNTSGLPSLGKSSDDKGNKSRKGGGRHSYEEYHGLPEVAIQHPHLKVGDPCECGGRLYKDKPSGFIQLLGQAPVFGQRYQRERLRCSLCGEVYTAPLPGKVATEGKYTPSLKASLALYRYHLGLPHYRLAAYQKQQGIPLPVASQWRCLEALGGNLIPLYVALLYEMAQRGLVYKDDTGMKVLSYFAENKQEDYSGPKGMRTTVMVSPGENREAIYLYVTGREHAGQNADKLLAERATPLGLQLHMSDGLSHNQAKTHQAIELKCFAHARRYILDALPQAEVDGEKILELIGGIYHNEAHCKKRELSEVERLYYHRRHSKPILSRLHAFFRKLTAEKRYEPNSAMGAAIKYWLSRWRALTGFTYLLGAPIDNNWAEQGVKEAIKHRKNSLFYKTSYGAFIGDVLMSIITTAHRYGVPLFPYLLLLQKHHKEVLRRPYDWLPWRCEKRIYALT